MPIECQNHRSSICRNSNLAHFLASKLGGDNGSKNEITLLTCEILYNGGRIILVDENMAAEARNERQALNNYKIMYPNMNNGRRTKGSFSFRRGRIILAGLGRLDASEFSQNSTKRLPLLRQISMSHPAFNMNRKFPQSINSDYMGLATNTALDEI
ncbi:hypothetical protein RF11_15190 [Thelohanellus kitauei]|uniref:Uncharacterized protein n=1 Tax=Thelohanellus kitauei TaxID=669202 RepID=A0A0C2MZD7_THEKT|nr:hypothetical protein RF11_15190 [Thelohanellus kitauei]